MRKLWNRFLLWLVGPFMASNYYVQHEKLKEEIEASRRELEKDIIGYLALEIDGLRTRMDRHHDENRVDIQFLHGIIHDYDAKYLDEMKQVAYRLKSINTQLFGTNPIYDKPMARGPKQFDFKNRQ